MADCNEELILDLSNTKLTEVPRIPANIKKLDFRKNKIERLEFSEDTSIEIVDLSDNIFRDIAPLSALPSLRLVDCSYNLIARIPPVHLPALAELYLIANDIQRIENISFPNLKKLDLASNNIRAIENIEAPDLEELYLASNQIEEVPDIRYLTHLRVLDIQYNKLSLIDCAMLPPGLETLLLQGNGRLTDIRNIDRLTKLKMINHKNTRLGALDLDSSVTQW